MLEPSFTAVCWLGTPAGSAATRRSSNGWHLAPECSDLILFHVKPPGLRPRSGLLRCGEQGHSCSPGRDRQRRRLNVEGSSLAFRASVNGGWACVGQGDPQGSISGVAAGSGRPQHSLRGRAGRFRAHGLGQRATNWLSAWSAGQAFNPSPFNPSPRHPLNPSPPVTTRKPPLDLVRKNAWQVRVPGTGLPIPPWVSSAG